MSAGGALGGMQRLPGWFWLSLPAVALLPVWRWSAARFMDGSDDPLGVIALATLALFWLRDRKTFSAPPRATWFVFATMLVALATLNMVALPALARGVMATLAMCAALLAVREPERPVAALAGLALLALPLLSSLQFFAGFPLRVVTAELSRWLLGLFGILAERSGTTLVIDGRAVIVDAPCSGIQMAWAAYYAACAAGAWWRVPDARFVGRLPAVGITVLIGNVARNAILVAKEAGQTPWPDGSHEAVGLILFAAVCAFVVRHVRCAAAWSPQSAASSPMGPGMWRRPTVLNGLALALSMSALAGISTWSWLHVPASSARAKPTAVEWPRVWNGRELRPLALSAVEQRFADRFPGAIGRFSDGTGVVVLRDINAPTRMLHPAIDCYRGLGYRILAPQLVRTDGAQGGAVAAVMRRCFVAEKDTQRLRVCERIVDADGLAFTDTSAWYWAAVTGRSRGPWRAVTEAIAL